MTDTTPYQVPQEPGRWRALTLAVVVHLALLVFLYIGIRWQSETPQAVEAEVWGQQAKEAAPKPQPEPEPVVKAEPKPEVKMPPKEVEASKEKVDINLEREKKKLAEQKERERLEKAAADIAAHKKAEADAAKKLAAEKWKKNADAKASEKLHNEQMDLIRKQAGTGGSGTAPKSQSPGRADPNYVGRLIAKIKSNTVFMTPPDLPGNPAVEYLVELFPGGSVRSIKKLKSSGLPGFDEAVERAIRSSDPFPANSNGVVPPNFTFSHKPKDNQ